METIKNKAEEYARLNKKRLAAELTDISKYLPDESPISVFMAGSPGAGKTEYSKNLIRSLERDKNHKVIRVDPDDLRHYFPGYTGKNQDFETNKVKETIEMKQGGLRFDYYLGKVYSKDDLEKLL